METRSETDRIAEVLDKAQPGWEIEWATGDELREYSLTLVRWCTDPQDLRSAVARRARDRLKASVGNRVFHRVLNAALKCGAVALPGAE